MSNQSTIDVFNKALKTLSEKKVNRTEPIQWYYPSQKEAVKSLYGVSLESEDCVEKGIRFIKIQCFNLTPDERKTLIELKAREDEEYKKYKDMYLVEKSK